MKQYLIVALALLVSTAQGEDGTPADSPPANNQPAAEAPKSTTSDEIDDDTLLGQFKAGGLWMYPILVCSFICLAFALERLVNLRESRIIPTRLL